MDESVIKAIRRAVENEPFARLLKMELVFLEYGHSVVEMTYDQSVMDNIYQRAHGGAVFGLIDEAFETASQTCGVIAVALNMNVTYVASPTPSARLKAEAKEIAATKRTATYDIKVTEEEGRLLAVCQALVFRTGKPIPFLDAGDS